MHSQQGDMLAVAEVGWSFRCVSSGCFGSDEVIKQRTHREMGSLCESRLLCQSSLGPSNSFHFLHPFLHGWLREICPFLELLQNT
jgi:hypothetical protein